MAPKKDGAPVPGSPGPQAISFNTSCEIEIAHTIMQTAGQVRQSPLQATISSEIGVLQRFTDFAMGNRLPNCSHYGRIG